MNKADGVLIANAEKITDLHAKVEACKAGQSRIEQVGLSLIWCTFALTIALIIGPIETSNEGMYMVSPDFFYETSGFSIKSFHTTLAFVPESRGGFVTSAQGIGDINSVVCRPIHWDLKRPA